MTDPSTTSVDDHDPNVDYEGRTIVLEPVPDGLWLILLGSGLAVLGPAGGFLIGSIIGVGDGDAMINPVFLSMAIGLVLGGIGGLVALLGGLKFLRRRAAVEADADDPVRTSTTAPADRQDAAVTAD